MKTLATKGFITSLICLFLLGTCISSYAEAAVTKTTIILINSEAFLVDLDQTGEVMKKHIAVPDYFSSKYAHETQVRRSMAKVTGLSAVENHNDNRKRASVRSEKSVNLVMGARKKVDPSCVGQSVYHKTGCSDIVNSDNSTVLADVLTNNEKIAPSSADRFNNIESGAVGSNHGDFVMNNTFPKVLSSLEMRLIKYKDSITPHFPADSGRV